MTLDAFEQSLNDPEPPAGLSSPVMALWWDARGEWARAHALVDDLETSEGMAVHAYLHRREGVGWNADYWYKRAGTQFKRERLEDEWRALVEGLLG
jgi:hypothetical protein